MATTLASTTIGSPVFQTTPQSPDSVPAERAMPSMRCGGNTKRIRPRRSANLLVEKYLPLVKYNGERIWARLPEGVELDRPGIGRRLRPDGRHRCLRPLPGREFETYCVRAFAAPCSMNCEPWIGSRAVRSKASKLAEATKTLEARLGRHPTEQELASQLE